MNSLAVKGSLQGYADESNITMEEAFLKCDVVVMVDVSGSMADYENREDGSHRTRFVAANEALKEIQSKYEGRVALLQFSDSVSFKPNGKLDFEMGGTYMELALGLAVMADMPGMKFILISDGYPNDEEACRRTAAKFTQPIHGIYIGPKGSDGEEFLRQLCALTGGKSGTSANVVQDLLELTDRLLTVQL